MFDPSKFRELIEEVPPAVKADPFSLNALIEWLEKQPAGKAYDYIDIDHCLIGQYIASIGGFYSGCEYHVGEAKIGASSVSDAPHLHRVAYLHEGEDTFGAALSRALALRGAP